MLLLAGGALAMAGRDLTWLPGDRPLAGRAAPRNPARPRHAPVRRDATGRGAPSGWRTPAGAPRRVADGAAGDRKPARVEARARARADAARRRPRTSREAAPAPRRASPGASVTPAPGAGAPAARHRPDADALRRAPSLRLAAHADTRAPPARRHAVDSTAPATDRGADANRRRHAAPATPAAATVAAASPIVAESRSFASALERWHRDHDAAAALAALDAHERRFPSGQIRLEARLLRAEILLASGRDGDALALLDQLALAGLPRARELRTVRGELRIKLGRCADGKADLQAVLAAGDGGSARAARAASDRRVPLKRFPARRH